MRHPVPNYLSRITALLLATAALSSCTDQPVEPRVTEPEPVPAPLPMGVYEFRLTGTDGSDPDAFRESRAVELAPDEGSLTLTPYTSGLTFDVVSSSSVTEGVRGQGGQRYISVTYRVRNGTGAPISNLTFVPAIRSSTIAGTAFSSLLRFNNTAASTSIAPLVVPTSAVYIEGERMFTPTADVLQVFEEPEIAAITLPAGTSSLFPYGFVVRNASDPNTRTIPTTTDPNEWGGVVTFAFRYPLQPGGAADDPFFISFQVLAVEDTETRMTESMEEAQDTAAVRRLRTRATALGATTVTILAGSKRQLPSELDYPGQRLICNPRVAGTAAAPVTRMRSPAGYTLLKQYMVPGETHSDCEPDYRQGTPLRPATNVPFTVQARAYDRYGNLRTAAVDTVVLRTAAGSPPAVVGTKLPLISGQRDLTITFSDYGTAEVGAIGRRIHGWQQIPVAGVTRTWTAGAGTTSWHTNANWSPAAVPMHLDSVLVPTTPSGGAFFPVTASNVSVQGVTVENGATIALGPFDLTADGNVATGTSGGINSSVGRVILTGIAKTVRGNLPRTRVLGTYTLDGNVTTVAPTRVESGRLRNTSFRIRTASQ